MSNLMLDDNLTSVAALIDNVKYEDALYDAENRTVEREKIMLPVQIVAADETEIYAFSRDLSNAGICLVTREPVKQDSECSIRISQSNARMTQVAARCVWSKAFGFGHCISGWQFMGSEDEQPS